MIEILSTIDWIIASTAVLLSVVVFQRALTKGSIVESLAEAPDRVHTLREDALALAVLAYLLAVALMSTVVRQFDEQADSALSGMVIGGGAQLMGLMVCLFIVAGRFEGGIGRFMLGGCSGHLNKVVVVCVVLSLGLCTLVLGATERILSVLLPEYTFNAHPTIETLYRGEQPLGVVIGLWIGAVGLAPLAEEVFFRGLLQTFLVGLLRSRWRAIALVSLAFAAVHVSQPHAIPALMVLSFLMGYAYERTGALRAPVMIHAIFNLKTLIWSALAGAGS